MVNRTKYERTKDRKLDYALCLKIEPWAVKYLGDIAHKRRISRSELIRKIIMDEVETMMQPKETAAT